MRGERKRRGTFELRASGTREIRRYMPRTFAALTGKFSVFDMFGESFVRVVSWEVSAVFALFLPVLLPRYLNRDESRRRRRPRCPSVVSEAGHPSLPSPPLQYLPKKKNWRRPRCRTVFTIPFFTAPSFRVREGKCGSRKSLPLCDAIPSE